LFADAQNDDGDDLNEENVMRSPNSARMQAFKHLGDDELYSPGGWDTNQSPEWRKKRIPPSDLLKQRPI